MWVLCILWLKFSRVFQFCMLSFQKITKMLKSQNLKVNYKMKRGNYSQICGASPHRSGAKRIKIWSEKSLAGREGPAVYLKQIFVHTKCLNTDCHVLSIWQGEIRMWEWWSWRFLVFARMWETIIDVLATCRLLYMHLSQIRRS